MFSLFFSNSFLYEGVMHFGFEDHKTYGVSNIAINYMQLTNNSYYWSTYMDSVYFNDENLNNFNYMS